MRRRLSFLIATITLVSLGSCAVRHTVPQSDLTTTSPQSAGAFSHFSTPEGQRVVGYTTTDGRFHRFTGWARLIADTMVFHRPDTRASGLMKEEPATTERVPVADLKSVRTESIDSVRTVLLVGALTGVVVVMAWVGYYLATMGS
jgi:hypothetical protein